jgi:hypothetical protein
MTVKELIRLLKDVPEDLEVHIQVNAAAGWTDQPILNQVGMAEIGGTISHACLAVNISEVELKRYDDDPTGAPN